MRKYIISEQWYAGQLQARLTPARFTHSLGVMQVMGELADVYGIDREKARLTGLLHDAAKDLTPEEQEKIITAAGIEVNHASERDYSRYMHGPVGAVFLKSEFSLNDPEILDAIRMHCYMGNASDFPPSRLSDTDAAIEDESGASFHRPLDWSLSFVETQDDHAIAEAYFHTASGFHAPLAWCLRVADIIEPNRDWTDNRWLRPVFTPLHDQAFAGRMLQAARMITARIIEWYQTEDIPIHPGLSKAWRDLSAG